MAAKFEVRQNGTAEFRFVLISQGRVLATSEAYSRKASCVKAIESLRKAAAAAPIDDTTARPANGAPAAKAAARSRADAPAPAKSEAAPAAKKAAPKAEPAKSAAPEPVPEPEPAPAPAKPEAKAKKSAAPRKRGSRAG